MHCSLRTDTETKRGSTHQKIMRGNVCVCAGERWWKPYSHKTVIKYPSYYKMTLRKSICFTYGNLQFRLAHSRLLGYMTPPTTTTFTSSNLHLSEKTPYYDTCSIDPRQILTNIPRFTLHATRRIVRLKLYPHLKLESMAYSQDSAVYF